MTATKNETLRHNRSTPDGKADRVDIPITGMSCAACAKIGYATAGTARVEFIVDDPARPSGSAQPLEKHLYFRLRNEHAQREADRRSRVT